ncbi:MAG: DUF222 domain-containing protein, partial [Streptosporangiaceae bacterium]
MSAIPAFSSASEAMDMVHAGLGFLAAADTTAMAAETQARCLQMLEQTDAMSTAARTSILAAFTSAQGYCADADYSPRAWLINRTRITKGAAVSYTAWVGRAAAHPQVAATLAAGEMSESYARTICGWTDKLPQECRPDADAILLAAAGAGMDLPDLAALAAEICARSLPDTPDSDKDEAFDDRYVRLETTFDGAGVLNGDLTPECAVLDALSAPAGAEDTRSQAQRCHDGLQEATAAAGHCGSAAGAGRAAGEGLGPHLAGGPAAAGRQFGVAGGVDRGIRAQWAAHRAVASAGGSDGGAWLDGDAAEAMACDAAMAPVVTGDVDPAALEDLVRLCVQLDKLRCRAGDGDDTGTDADDPASPGPDTTRAWEALEQAVIGKAVDLLSGPGGLAGFLRRRQLGARLGGPSLPLDIGFSQSIPAGIRNA